MSLTDLPDMIHVDPAPGLCCQDTPLCHHILTVRITWHRRQIDLRQGARTPQAKEVFVLGLRQHVTANVGCGK